MPRRCWVGSQQKVCYGSEEEAEGAARLVEREHGLAAGSLRAYRCDLGTWDGGGQQAGAGEHWHLANQR